MTCHGAEHVAMVLLVGPRAGVALLVLGSSHRGVARLSCWHPKVLPVPCDNLPRKVPHTGSYFAVVVCLWLCLCVVCLWLLCVCHCRVLVLVFVVVCLWLCVVCL